MILFKSCVYLLHFNNLFCHVFQGKKSSSIRLFSSLYRHFIAQLGNKELFDPCLSGDNLMQFNGIDLPVGLDVPFFGLRTRQNKGLIDDVGYVFSIVFVSFLFYTYYLLSDITKTKSNFNSLFVFILKKDLSW